MKSKAILIVSFVIITYGLFRVDSFLIPTLDYFGKFVYFGLFNIFTYFVVYKTQKFFNEKKEFLGDILAIVISIGFVLATLKI